MTKALRSLPSQPGPGAPQAPRPAPDSASNPLHGGFLPLLELGRGGMGVVLLARHPGVSGHAPVAVVKRMHKHLLGDPESVRRFLNEARTAAWVNHANVVAIHEIGEDHDGYYLLLDYVEGDSLDGLMSRSRARGEPLPRRVLFRVALDALAGLRAVHEARDKDGRALDILHRDVSPQNLLVGADGVTRLSDFGVARDVNRSVGTDQHAVVGKALYMPPEYLRQEPVDCRFDLYGMGITLWIGLCGERPWNGLTDPQIWFNALLEGLPRASSVNPDIPPDLDAFVARACAASAEDRFPSAQAMADALAQIAPRNGGVASQDEVGERVRRLVGDELERRRRVLARGRVESQPPSRPPSGRPTAAPPSHPLLSPDARATLGPSDLDPAPLPPPSPSPTVPPKLRSRTPLWLAASGVLLALLVLLARSLLAPPATTADQDPSPAMSSEAAPAASGTPNPDPSVSPVPPPPAPPASFEPVTRRVNPVLPGRLRLPIDPPRPPDPRPRGAPTTVTTVNPYR